MRPVALNVDGAHVETAVKTLMQQDNSLHLLNEATEIVSNDYLDALAGEINEFLEDIGAVTFGELATRQPARAE